MSERTSGWSPIEHVVTHGDGAEPLAAALSCEGREDRWTHGFHTYPAGLHPDAARSLLGVVPEGRLLDPFAGGGTTLIEGMAAGREVLGLDVSPIALVVCRARTWLADDYTPLRSAGRKIADGARGWPDLPPPQLVRQIQRWYDAHVARELEGIRVQIHTAPPSIRPLLEACFSSILIKASHRVSDTSRRFEHRHRPPGTTAVLFHKKVRELGRRLEDLRQAVPAETPRAWLMPVDARSFQAKSPFDAAITSPPYPGVYDYLSLQELRVAWLDLDDRAGRHNEIAARRNFRADRRRALKAWRRDTDAWTARVFDALRPGGRLAITIGDGLVGDKLVDSLAPTLESGTAAGFRLVARASGDRLDYARERVRREHVVLFERPAANAAGGPDGD